MMTTRRSTWFVLGSLSLMAVGFALHANPKEQPTPAAEPQIKAAVLNMSYVIQNYKKWKEYQGEYKAKLGTFDVDLKKLKENLDNLSRELLETDVDRDRRKQIKMQMEETQRAMQDKADEGKKALQDLESKQFLKIYDDVAIAAERHAKAHGIEIVMQFIDGTTEEEVNNPKNISRKVTQPALYPLYVAPGLDISKKIVAALNEDYDRAK